MKPNPKPKPAKSQSAQSPSAQRQQGNELIGMGLGVGAIGALGATVLGATCPICVVAAPALLGAGVFKRWRAKRVAPERPEPEQP